MRIYQLPSENRPFAATGFGMKTRMAPLSAAIANAQLARLDEHNAERNGAIDSLSHHLEPLGIHTLLPPPHIYRTYFEYLASPDTERIGLSTNTLIRALQAEGCQVQRPRYPLLHQQPFFTEGHAAQITRLQTGHTMPTYDPDDLPRTRTANDNLIRLPTFSAKDEQLLKQYALAFERVIDNAGQL